jgi:phytoene dehydrogenase-like protein
MNELIPKQKADPHRSRPHQKYSIFSSEYLHNLIRDGRLRRILGSIGTREPYRSLPLLAAMWNLMSDEGIWFSEEGMQPFCERFVKVLVGGNENRGEIRKSKEVAKIRTDQGKVLGVILKDGPWIMKIFVMTGLQSS